MKSIIDCLKEYNCLCEFNATDFNADKAKLKGKVWQMMAAKYANENLDQSRNSSRETCEDIAREEYKAYKVIHD